eukprot:PITA_33125
MAAVVSTYFRKIAFPSQGGITIIDQQTFLPNSSEVTGSISMIHGSPNTLHNIGVGLLKYPTLMGTFTLQPPTNLAEVTNVGTLDSERNLSNIEETTAINISTKTDVVENIHVGKSCSSSELEIYSTLFHEFRDVFAWSYDEMPGIDSSIVEHEIKMYPDVKPVRQRLRQVHPNKVVAIKAEVEKLLHAGFIYPIPLTNWVSNIVPVMKKQGTIRVCVDYRDVNQSCPKDNYPTPFID